MGYFRNSLMELYEEFKVVINQDEHKKFHRLFEEEYTIESLPSFLFLLIDLARFLLHEIKAKENDLGKDNNDNEEEKRADEPCLRITGNDVGRRGVRVAKALSTFKCVPLEVASKPFSFRSTQDCLKVEKVGSKFFLKTTVHHLNKFEIIEVTKDASKMDLKIGDGITHKMIIQSITHLCFTGIESNELANETATNMLTVEKSFENIQEISFKGNFVQFLIRHYYFAKEFWNAALHLTKTCKKLKHIIYIRLFPLYRR